MINKAVASVVNSMWQQFGGDAAITQINGEDFCQIGRAYEQEHGTETVFNQICDKITRTLLHNQGYDDTVFDYKMINYGTSEKGSVIEMLKIGEYEAKDAAAVFSPVNGTKYDSFNVYEKPDVKAYYYDGTTQFCVPVWKPRFNSLFSAGMDSFTTLLTGIAVQTDNCIKSRLMEQRIEMMCELIGRTLNKENPYPASTAWGDMTGTTHAVNLLKMYNDLLGATETKLTVADFKKNNKALLRFFVQTIKKYMVNMKVMSSNFNNAGNFKCYSTDEDLKLVVLHHFESALESWLLNGEGQYNNQYIGLPPHKTVPFWQGPGNTNKYSLEDCSNVKIRFKVNNADGTQSVAQIDSPTVLAVLYNVNTLGIYNEKTWSGDPVYNQDIDQYRYITFYTQGHIINEMQQSVVFYIADTTPVTPENGNTEEETAAPGQANGDA